MFAGRRKAPESPARCPGLSSRLQEREPVGLLPFRPTCTRSRVPAYRSRQYPWLILDPERARWRPSGLYVSEIERVELSPQDVTLVAQSLDRTFLRLARFGVLVYVADSERRILGSLLQSRLEVVEAGSEPCIMLAQPVDAQRDQVAGEQFRQ